MNDEIKKSFETIQNSISDSDDILKKMQLEINPLKEIFSQQDKIKKLIKKDPFIPKIPNIEHINNPNLASEFHKRIAQWIQEFDANLDQEHEVGVKLISFGQTTIFHLQDMGFWNPSLILFKGFTDEDQPVQLIQHVSQISILIMKVKRINTSQPKRQIGFAPWEDA